MISWIQTTFQRHFRVIFLTLLAVLIVSFVFTIGAAPGIGAAERNIQARTFFDLNLSNPDDQATVYEDASLSVFLQAGPQNFSSEQIQEYALQRYAALYLANQANLPGPDATQLKDFIQTMGAFAGQNGEFDPAAYTRFRDNLRLAGQFSEADVTRVLANDYRVQRMRTLLGGPGYAQDGEIAFQLAASDTRWSANVARVDYTTFAPSIEPTEDQLQTYFAANSFRYESPALVRVSYLEIPATRYLTQVELSDDEIRAYYESNPARFPKPTAAADAPEVPALGAVDALDADFAAVRDQVSAALRFERARRLATDAASDLTVALFDAKVSPQDFSAWASSRGETVRNAPPFARAEPPDFLRGSLYLAAPAFELSPDRPLSDAIPTALGAVVMMLEEQIAPAPSAFADVADRVRADFIEAEKRQRFVSLGRTIQSSLKEKLQAGATFTDAVAALTDLQGATVQPSSFSDFTRREPPPEFPFSALNSLERLNAGDVSDMVLMSNHGLITHAAAKDVPPTDRSNPRFAELAEQLSAYNATLTATGIVRGLVAKELNLDATPPAL